MVRTRARAPIAGMYVRQNGKMLAKAAGQPGRHSNIAISDPIAGTFSLLFRVAGPVYGLRTAVAYVAVGTQTRAGAITPGNANRMYLFVYLCTRVLISFFGFGAFAHANRSQAAHRMAHRYM